MWILMKLDLNSALFKPRSRRQRTNHESCKDPLTSVRRPRRCTVTEYCCDRLRARTHAALQQLLPQICGGSLSAMSFATLSGQVDRKVLEEAFVKFGDLKTVSSSLALCGTGGGGGREAGRHRPKVSASEVEIPLDMKTGKPRARDSQRPSCLLPCRCRRGTEASASWSSWKLMMQRQRLTTEQPSSEGFYLCSYWKAFIVPKALKSTSYETSAPNSFMGA